MALTEDYLSDSEQEEALRSWWRENWPWIVGGVVLGLALLAGWRYWTTRQEQGAADAAKLYESVESALVAKDYPRAKTELDKLTADFDRSAYAQQGRMALAKIRVEESKYDEAAALLRTAMEKSQDQELAHVARLRLARILVQQNKHDEALQQLKPDDLGKFAAHAREIRGDALIAKGDAEGARAEYAAALSDAGTTIDRNLVELKLQEVGGTAPAAAATMSATKPAASKP
jgi:predicted negative regulator of RcsB-dependent stress response